MEIIVYTDHYLFVIMHIVCIYFFTSFMEHDCLITVVLFYMIIHTYFSVGAWV